MYAACSRILVARYRNKTEATTNSSLFSALDGLRLADISRTTAYGLWGADGTAPHATWRAALLEVANDRPTDRTHDWRERLATSEVGIGMFDQAYGRLVALLDHVFEERLRCCELHIGLLRPVTCWR
jgi:hypothetical protein